MPPKRRGGASSGAPNARSGQKKGRRQSKLAKENDISADEEAEIKEAFSLFATEHEDYPDEKAGVIPTPDVRRAMIALGIAPTDSQELRNIFSAIDPSGSGVVPYEPFVAACALKLHARSNDDDARDAEAEHAFRLFTRNTEGPIMVAHLRRVARDLHENVDEDMLRDMVHEANGGQGLQAGVNLEQFKDVMARAGVL